MAHDDLPPLLAGVYQHYRGPLYLVLGYAHDANQDGRTVVVYVGLELTPTAKPGARMSVRDVTDFFAIVDPVDGWVIPGATEPIQGQARRFTYLGPALGSEGLASRTPEGQPYEVGTAFDFAHRLRDPRFRQAMMAAGYISGVPISVASPESEDRVRRGLGPGRNLLAISDPDAEFGYRLEVVDVPMEGP